MANVVTAHSFRSNRDRSRQPLVYEPWRQWPALLLTFVAVFAVWATIFLFAL
jgi:hypothetical protein